MAEPAADSPLPAVPGAAEVVADLAARGAVARTYDGDHTLWRDDPTEIADRLGWLPVIAEVQAGLASLAERCDALVAGVEHVVVMGMGGSSLFPEVLARTFTSAPGRPRLHVLDTTAPGAIRRLADQCPPDRTLHVASSKSGTTIETRSHLEWAWERAGGRGRFAAITDPGSELGALARERGFADVFENRPDIGGRYSALSLFGVVPALLAGVDAGRLLAGGLDGLAACGPEIPAHANPALALAAAMAAGVACGRDKLTIALPPRSSTLGVWIEQLVAESLGKDGTGVVPVVGEPLAPPEVCGDDRLLVLDESLLADPRARALADAGHPGLVVRCPPDPHAVGRFVVVAELATALAGAALGVQPFDQPDVAAAKAATNEVLATGEAGVPEVPAASLLDTVEAGDHLALQAFVDPGGEAGTALENARLALRDRLGVATTLGYGPRFLHSTGQLHKGGPRSIVCVQVLSDDAPEVAIPGRDHGFGHLMAAQATGDLRTLQARGIRAGRVALDDLLDLTS